MFVLVLGWVFLLCFFIFFEIYFWHILIKIVLFSILLCTAEVSKVHSLPSGTKCNTDISITSHTVNSSLPVNIFVVYK